MAETPLCAYAAVDSAPGLVLTVLYRHAPATEVRAYISGAPRPPLARCDTSQIRACLPRMGRTQIFANLSALRAKGLIRDEDGGFLLLARESGKPDSAGPPGALLEELAHLHHPAARHRQFTPTNGRHLDLAEQLLADVPAEAALAYARDFAQVIHAEPAHELRWRPAMLRPEVWSTICATVDTWRRERAAEAEAEAFAIARRGEKALMSQAYVLIQQAVRRTRQMVVRAGYEAEEAVQEIADIFMQRQRGAHPYACDRSRANAPLKSYVYMLTRSVLLNRIARADRRARGLEVLAAHHRDRSAELDVEALMGALNPPPSGDGAKTMGTPTAGRKPTNGAKTISKAG